MTTENNSKLAGAKNRKKEDILVDEVLTINVKYKNLFLNTQENRKSIRRMNCHKGMMTFYFFLYFN